MFVVHAAGVTFAAMKGQKASRNSVIVEEKMPQALPLTEQEGQLSERNANNQASSAPCRTSSVSANNKPIRYS